MDAKIIINRVANMQRDGKKTLCPRCGRDSMNEKLVRNAVSRYARPVQRDFALDGVGRGEKGGGTVKPWYLMTYREQEKYFHDQKRKEIPVPDIDAIRKGIDVCLSGGLPQRCVECPYRCDGCNSELERDALDLINIQSARIAELEEALNRGKS